MKFRSAFRSIGLTLAAASLLAVPACYGVTREFAQTYHLKPDGTLELNNINGTVRIEGWDRDEIEVPTAICRGGLDLVGFVARERDGRSGNHLTGWIRNGSGYRSGYGHLTGKVTGQK